MIAYRNSCVLRSIINLIDQHNGVVDDDAAREIMAQNSKGMRAADPQTTKAVARDDYSGLSHKGQCTRWPI